MPRPVKKRGWNNGKEREMEMITGMTWLLISLAVVWSMAWKGIALWQASRNSHLVWYIVMFIINTLGILEIIYIFAFSRKRV
ncbi:DUF5652 family protein [Chloroflexota bacterium]